VRQVGVDGVNRCLDAGGRNFPRDQHADITSTVAHEHNLLSVRHKLGKSVFDGFGETCARCLAREDSDSSMMRQLRTLTSPWSPV
jgi:hypothetical protein